MKYIKLWAFIAFTFSLSVQAEQKLKVFLDGAKNPSEINKLKNVWSNKYQRRFTIIHEKSNKMTIRVSPALSDTEQELFIRAESRPGLELEMVNSEPKQEKVNKRVSFGQSKVQ